MVSAKQVNTEGGAVGVKITVQITRQQYPDNRTATRSLHALCPIPLPVIPTEKQNTVR